MAIKKFKPTTPGRRAMTGYTFEELTKKEPEKSLVVSLKSSGGRNSGGRITARHRGGDINGNIASSISSAIKMVSPLKWRPSNTIPIVPQELPYCTI